MFREQLRKRQTFVMIQRDYSWSIFTASMVSKDFNSGKCLMELDLNPNKIYLNSKEVDQLSIMEHVMVLKTQDRSN